jgi:hypothetical protein
MSTLLKTKAIDYLTDKNKMNSNDNDTNISDTSSLSLSHEVYEMPSKVNIL